MVSGPAVALESTDALLPGLGMYVRAAARSSPLSRSVLIVKLAAIGDVTMALPMVSALRSRDSSTRIAWMCGRTVAPLLRRVDGIAEVIVVDERSMLAGSPATKVRAVLDAWRKIFGRRFDAVYIAHTDVRYQVLAWAARAAARYRLGPRHRLGRAMVPGRSHTDEYIRLITGVDDHRARSFGPPVVDAPIPAAIARRIEAFNPDARPLVAITPGGAKNVARENPLRRWPLERYAELADALHARGYRVVLTGDRTDGWVRSLFLDRPVLDLIGATDLPTLVAVLRLCTVVAAHDSGPLHLARLVGTPVVALLGPTPPAMFFRTDAAPIVLWPGETLPCAPCYDGYDFANCDNNVCMQLISVSTVLENVLSSARKANADGPSTSAISFGSSPNGT